MSQRPHYRRVCLHGTDTEIQAVKSLVERIGGEKVQQLAQVLAK